MDTSGLVKIDDIVRSYLNETGVGLENYWPIKQIVIEGLTNELNVSHSDGIKVFYGQVNAVNILQLPGDFIKHTRIGVVLNGQVYTLTKNDNINLPDGEICGVEQVNADLLKELHIPVALNYAKGGAYNFGEFRVDDAAKRIVFRGSLQGEIMVVEYRSSGISLEGETYVSVLAVPVLKEYVDYTLIKRRNDVSEARVRRSMVQFIDAKRKFIKRKNPFNYMDVLDAINYGRSQGVK